MENTENMDNTNKTETPRTDDLSRGNHVVPTWWAEQLERELNEANQRIKAWQATRLSEEQWKRRVQWLEEQASNYFSGFTNTTGAKPDMANISVDWPLNKGLPDWIDEKMEEERNSTPF